MLATPSHRVDYHSPGPAITVACGIFLGLYPLCLHPISICTGFLNGARWSPPTFNSQGTCVGGERGGGMGQNTSRESQRICSMLGY